MGIVRDARDAVLTCHHADPQRALEWEAIKVSLATLRTFPFIAEREAAGELKLHGSWFAISEGSLYVLDEDSGSFSAA
jgi:carbonic anhydrase